MKLTTFCLTAVAALSTWTGSFAADKESAKESSTPVYGVVDLAHSFSFYGDGRFAGQYIMPNNTPRKGKDGEKGEIIDNGGSPQNKMTTSWGNLYDYPADNVNLLVFLACDTKVPYNDKDYAYIDKFLKDGGAVLIMGGINDPEQEKLAKHYGATFTASAKAPLKLTKNAPYAQTVESNSGSIMEFETPDAWTVFVEDSEGQPVFAQRKEGKGTVLVGSRTLAGSHPDASDNINAAWLGKVISKATQGKKVDPAKPFEGRWLTQLGNKKQVGSLLYHYSDYLEPYLDAMVKIDTKLRPLIEKRMGVPLSPGMAGEVGLLATGGGGFSSGSCVGLAVFWGDFPEKEDSMVEFLTHEAVHSWVLPYPEVANEPIATYVGNLVMLDAGHAEEGQRRIDACIEGAKNVDPTMKLYDLSGNSKNPDAKELDGGQKNAIHWGKSFWIWEEMRKKDPNFNAKYFQAKRKYVKDIPQYTMDDTVAVMSYALGEDLFPWFNEHGITVDKKNVKAKVPAPGAKE